MRLALCSPLAESTPEARLLVSHGYTTKVVAGASSADFTLPCAGGSIAFVLHKGEAAQPHLVERAAAASRAARRCTVLSVGVSAAAAEAMQALCPSGVSVARCEGPEVAVEHMLSCAQRAAAVRAADADSSLDEQFAVAKHASEHLARLWGADPHEVDFMLTQRSLCSLAAVTSEEAWHRLTRENQERDGTLHPPALLYAAVEWMQNDGAAQW